MKNAESNGRGSVKLRKLAKQFAHPGLPPVAQIVMEQGYRRVMNLGSAIGDDLQALRRQRLEFVGIDLSHRIKQNALNFALRPGGEQQLSGGLKAGHRLEVYQP